MIKKAGAFALFAAAVLFLGSCSSNNDVAQYVQPTVNPTAQPVVDTPKPQEIVKILPDDNINFEGLNLFWQNTHNIMFPSDDNARLSLYVNAEITDDGEFAFDTGHEWLLVMETSFGDFPLFPRQRLQHGSVSMNAFIKGNGYVYDTFHVLVTVQQSAGLEIFDFVFDNDAKVFRKIPVYSATNINPMVRKW